MRLIDADKLQEIVQNVANISKDKDVKYCLLELKAAINSCPTVDIDSIKSKCRWYKSESTNLYTNPHHDMIYYIKEDFNYCPCCGKEIEFDNLSNYNQAILDVLKVIDDVQQEHKDKSLEINYGSFLWLEREIRKLIKENE